MNIKKYLPLFLCVWSFSAWAADKPTADFPTGNRNYYKVCFLNEKDEVLVVQFKGVWELIGGEYNTTMTMIEYVDTLAATSNIEVDNVRLRGLFSVYFNKATKPYVYQYYSARYKSGELKTPDDCMDAKWVSLEEARELIQYEDMLNMYEKCITSENLWGGTYRITKDREKHTRTVDYIVDYFNLN